MRKNHKTIPVPDAPTSIDFSLSFAKTAACARLQKLARRPIDMRAPGVLTPERFQKYVIHTQHLDYHYAGQRVDAQVLDALCALSQELSLPHNLSAQVRGAVMNQVAGHPSEQRPVLHTSLRNIFDDKHADWGPVAAEISTAARAEMAKLSDFVRGVESGEIANERGERFETMIAVGIGGSELGPHALYLALAPQVKRRVHFLSNVDPDDFALLARAIERPERVLVVVVSKSGTTLETQTNEAIVYEKMFAPRGLAKNKHFVAITTAGSPMDDPQSYRACFYMFDSVSGRLSATSMVGGVPIAFACGIDVFERLLRGAHDMDIHALTPEAAKNMPLMAALLAVWNRNFLGCGAWAILPYSQLMSRYPAHLQQLFMESNGKLVRRDGTLLADPDKPDSAAYETSPVIFGEPGTNGQHSFYQMLHQHPGIAAQIELIGFAENTMAMDMPFADTTSQEKLLCNLLAQTIAFAQGKNDANPGRFFPGNRPVSLVMGKRLIPESLGALLAYHEAVSAYMGYIWGINSWDQEGVQLGKVLANRLLDHLRAQPERLEIQRKDIEYLLTRLL